MVNRDVLAAVIGCGPAGLITAHTLDMYNIPFVIFSEPKKSMLGGAQFSHVAIKGIHDPNEPEAMLTYVVRGEEQVYHDKVYGAQPVPFVSFSKVQDGQKVPAWSLARLYDGLWDRFEDRVVPLQVQPERLYALPHAFDLVFNSAPANRMCLGTVDGTVQHVFQSAPVRLVNYALDSTIPDNTIVYDGTKDHSWYRCSKIFGVGSTEWGGQVGMPPVEGVRSIYKPIKTNCDCFKGRVIRIGRFGTWSKGELTMHAYNRVLDTIAELGLVPD